MSRRERIDPETTRVVEERLQRLLTVNGPSPGPVRAAGPEPAGNRERDDGLPSRPAQTRRAKTAEDAESASRRPTLNRDGAGRGGLLAGSGRAIALGFGRSHLVVVGVVLALGLVIAGWAVLRARPVAVAVTPPPVSAATPAESPAAPGADASQSPQAEVVVHVLGAVKKPGLVTLSGGSRVQDALEEAGGLIRRADPGELNLAQPVADGQQIVVGTKNKPNGEVREGTSAGGTGGASDGAASGPGGGSAAAAVNLNTATAIQLEELPGVGPVMAGRIVAWRTENGRFSRIEELQEIDGVGPKTYAKLAPLCRV
ncbi:MAG: ComEA family DNA-binding protein [Microlunatus sp.]|nr:ComEA family DNA-binding protein [Microlunatus sp.]MDN5770023.1 ComEA family DNA-binding protein [Microlunatus sp.]